MLTPSPRRRAPCPFRRTVVVIATGALVAAAALTGSAAAAPASIASVRASIASAQSQLNALMDRTEAATEAYNGGRIKLAAAQVAATAAAAKVGRADAAVRTAQANRQRFAASAYRSTTFDKLSALLSGDPQTAMDKVGALDALSRRQEAAQQTLRLARRDATAARTAASAALSTQQHVFAGLTAQKQAIEGQVAQQRGLISRLQAQQAELIRQERAREAAAKAAAERAAAAAAAAAAEQQAAALRQQAAATASAGSQFSSGPVSAAPPVTPAPSGGGGGAVALAAAYAELGKPYVWAAAGPDTFDCSGLTQWAWAKAGVALAHYTGDQWNQGTHIDRNDLQPGDLVFFGSDLHHVGMYAGNGNMIDAPHTGAVVRVEPIWWGSYAGAVRP